MHRMMRLVIGAKFSSTWTMRGWLACRLSGLAFTAETHASFAELRAAMPMNLVKRWPIANGIPSNAKLLGRPGVEPQLARMQESWRQTRAAWGEGGPYLFGARFNFADAMWAPMASRFRTYSVPLAPDAQAYAEAVLAHPLVAEWVAAAEEQAREIGWDACAAWP
jgi:glutathione S-transferase